MENGVRGRQGRTRVAAQQKARDFTQPFFHKSTLLSTAQSAQCVIVWRA